MSTHGYPDYQRYAQWFGAPLVDVTAFAIGAGSHTDGPFNVNNWSSVILYIQPTGGAITATVRQTSSGVGSGLVSDTVIQVSAGTTRVQSIVLLGNSVSLILQGAAGGETVSYSLVPSNTAVNTGTVTNPTIGVQHNGALVGNEPTVDFEDATGFTWIVADDAPGTRVKVTPQKTCAARIRRTTNQSIASGPGVAITFDATDFDTDGMVNIAAHPTRLTCVTAGIYDLFAGVEWQGVAGGVRTIYLQVNGATIIALNQINTGGAAGDDMTVSTTYQFAAADYVELFVSQNSGVALNVDTAGRYSPVLGATKQ